MRQFPIEDLASIAAKNRCHRAILLAADDDSVHVVTWGDSVHDSDLAAEDGNRLKRIMGWGEHLCREESVKVKSLLDRIQYLENYIESHT